VGGDETVLVVEDDARLRQVAFRQLAELGYQVREAEHAAAAFAILAGGDRVSLLFSDVVMPGTTDGTDLARKAQRLQPGLKVLLTSGFPGVRGADQRVTDCPFPLLRKPYRRDELAQAVRAVLDRDAGHATAGVTWPGGQTAARPAGQPGGGPGGQTERETQSGARVVMTEQV
jgi:DNA-binding NtrC family response regulator